MAYVGGILNHLGRWLSRIAVLLCFAAGVVLLMLWLSGAFAPKVAPIVETNRNQTAAPEEQVVAARVVPLRRFESAVGTVRAVHEAAIGSKLLARVMEINLKAGQQVKIGDVLVRLDDTDLRAKLQQAKAAVSAAEAVRSQAVLDESRYGALVKSKSVSQQDYDKAATALHAADANLERAQETAREVQATLDWATIRSPIDGTVIDKKVEAGDTVTPGQVLLTLYDPRRMQLVASVRESLAKKLREGQEIGVVIEGLEKQCQGKISEIVPEAQSASRTFQVKVTGPCPEGIYSGMFGRILIPLGEERIVMIPRQSVSRVGQLELVQVVNNGQASLRAIRTGREFGEVTAENGQALRNQVEVLSGLAKGEEVVVPVGPSAERDRAAEAAVEPGKVPSQEANHE